MHRPGSTTGAAAFALALLAPRAAHAEPGDDLRVSLLTMSPGDQAFTKFGHDAILIEDRRTGSALVYNYGTFVFGSPWLAVDFLRGNLKYWLSVTPLDGVIRHYAAEERSIFAQDLRIAPAERWRLAQSLASIEASDARYYKYDYYQDNCATRVRDAIDHATGARLAAVSQGPAPFTYREETLRLTADDVLLSLGLDLAMGPLIDRPLTAWQSEFLPARLADAAGRVRVPTATGEEPLVARERVLLASRRRDLRVAPPDWRLPLLLAGLLKGGFLAALGELARRKRMARISFAVVIALLGLVIGGLGIVLLGLAALTDHAVTYWNANVLLCTPWSIALPFFALGVARGRPRSVARARAVAAASLATSLLVLIAIPWLHQKNTGFVALFLPLWLGLTVGLRRIMQPVA